jgi:hypothetical protein
LAFAIRVSSVFNLWPRTFAKEIMPTSLIHCIGIQAPGETIYEAITMRCIIENSPQL